MRRRLAYTRDTLQAHLLPSTEYMGLNYRPKLPPAATLWFTTLIPALVVILAVALVVATIEAAAPFWKTAWTILTSTYLWIAIMFLLAQHGAMSTWSPQKLYRRALTAISIGAVIAAGVYFSGSAEWALLPLVGSALCFSYLVAKQFAFWATVHPQVDWLEMRSWQSYWKTLFAWNTPSECPEFRTARMAVCVVCIQAILSTVVLQVLSQPHRPEPARAFAGLIALATLLAPLPVYRFLWQYLGSVPRIPLSVTIRAVFQSLAVWFGYQRGSYAPPGIFRFPDKWLRRFSVREIISALVLTVATNSILLLPPESSLVAPAALLNNLARMLFGENAEQFAAALPVACVLGVSLPILTILTLHWFVAGDLIARYWLAFEAPKAYGRSQTKSPWAVSINRMLNSPDSNEREHVLLGRALFGDYPVLLHKPLLYQHAHLVGDSGSRKTSLGIAPLIAQLVAARDCSVMVLDLKGDRSLFETARLEAKAADAEFRWFSLEAEHSSHVFNPLEQSHIARLTPNQRTQLILEGLSLNYGEAYGRGFYSAMNEVVLLTLLRHYPAPSFRKLHALLSDKQAYAAVGNPKDWENAQHLTALVDRLASIYALNMTADDLKDRPRVFEGAIDMGRLLTRSQVAYFSLKSPVEPIGSSAVAKLAMRSLFTAAAHRLKHQSKRVYVVIDEFQQVVSESVQLVLEQARGNNIHFIIAHQNIDQLDRQSIDIRSSVSSCTAFKQFFRASDPNTIRQLEELSGEGMFETLTWQQAVPPLNADQDYAYSPALAREGSVQVAEASGYRLERNLIMDISAAPNTSFVSFTEGSHFTQFGSYVTPIISDYHISSREYERRQGAPWPSPTDETVTNPDIVEIASLTANKSQVEPTPQETWDDRFRRTAGDGHMPTA